MKNNEENIPEYIFDWIEIYSFQKLEKEKQDKVLAYLPAEEYEELHQNFLLIKQNNITDKNVKSDESRTFLLNEFNKKYSHQKPKNILMQPVSLWKAAVVILAIGMAWIFTSYKQFPTEIIPNPVALIDTVYIEKEVFVEIPTKIYDTIFTEKKNDFVAKNTSIKNSKRKSTHNENIVERYKSTEHIVSINEIENLSNQPKRNSIQDDSLIKNYNFVRL